MSEPTVPPWHADTIVLHSGYNGHEHQRSAAVPIYQSTSYLFENAQQGADLFDLVEEGHIYARTGNPTQTVLEERIAQLEGGTAALAVASGMASIDMAIATLAQAGDHVVVASQLYGGTQNLIAHVLKARGITSTLVHRGELARLEQAFTAQTKAVFVESVANPSGNIADLATIAAKAHAHGIAIIVDNTSATPLLIRPFDHGADIVVHSATKYIGGHGNVIGGVIVDGGRFDWAAHPERYPQFTTPEPAFHHFVITEKFPEFPFVARTRTVVLRNSGASLAALSSFLLLQGLETLALRLDRISRNTRELLDFLVQHPLVSRVSHVSQPHHPDHIHARRYLRGGHVPGLISFELHGGRDAARRFYDALSLFQRLVNIGDSKSLAAIPAETTHHLLTDDELQQAGIAPGLVRLSVGIEHPEDLIADLRQALLHADAPRTEPSHFTTPTFALEEHP
ncbi:O-acetylhomoserine aminocarboxypropyltransferase/cysteine synthase family protein [Diaphorobacter caeni]|uniref:O-acetylhomoserine aminocarboxypropyltransferase/cysteine synthase family protein n=1 Tax=Diaphorobacter caeni TaxID=2784387 RepID=UPI00189069BF|nr:aminotransferase class I/II-fold pyridoxal phosphate-dependent enzyme [Diaphorobacter caeni]MBF5003782.1 O-acetylhomoserine aminocarboxypropyltransferase/cysteine synthase [Diaphorobacter caeni]